MLNVKHEDILDCKKTWRQVLGINKPLTESVTTSDVNPFHTDRIQDFILNENPEPIKSRTLDLSTLLILLKHRGCEINVPGYKQVTDSKIKDTQIRVGFENHGRIIDLKSNQSTFNFSVTVLNDSFVEVDGKREFETCPRTYTVTDFHGNLSDNWSQFVFDITDKEREYFQKSLGVDDSISCKEFVNNQLAQSMYTTYYRDMKVLIDRLVAERKYLNDLRKKYIPLLPKTGDHVEKETEPESKEESTNRFESKQVVCFETKISTIDKDTFKFGYINESLTPREIVTLCDYYLRGIVQVTGECKFYCRLIELAFTKMNPYKEDLKPTELQTYQRVDCKWNPNKVKLPRSRTEWFELMFKDYSILCRYFNKTVKEKIEEK